MKKIYLFLIISLLLLTNLSGDEIKKGRTIFSQGDGTSPVVPYEVKVNHTDNVDGTITITGDITSVGDVASGAAFDGTQGTTLTFNNASGDQTLKFDDTTQDFEFSNDVSITDITPHLKLIDSTAAEDDFEIYTDASQFVLTNITDLTDIIYVNSSNNIRLLRNTSIEGTTTLGTLAGAIDAGGAISFKMPYGANITVNEAGKIGQDTTDDQLLYGATPRVLAYTYEKCFTIEDIAAADDNVPIWSPNDAITVTRIYCRTQGGTSAGVTISDGTNAMEEVVCDSGGEADDGTLVNNTFTANERVEFDTGTVTGAVDFTNVCLSYTIDRQ